MRSSSRRIAAVDSGRDDVRLDEIAESARQDGVRFSSEATVLAEL